MNSKRLTVQLPNFQGPLDLLLHLIRTQKIDIYDIPIADITSQYLAYLKKMQDLNLQIAGEYFMMSATLLRIKSQLLLPQNNCSDEDDEDPRQELVAQLLQYSVFKKISAYLGQRSNRLPLLAAKEESAGSSKQPAFLAAGVVSSADLKRAFIAALHKMAVRHPRPATVHLSQTSIKDMSAYLQSKLTRKKTASFFTCLKQLHNLSEAIALFLAMLELAKRQKIRIWQKQEGSDLEMEELKDNG